MMRESHLKIVNIVWWRFFWRYAVIFIVLNVVAGATINYFGQYFPKGLYATTMFYGLCANLLASSLVMFYCLNRKFKKSSIVLQAQNGTNSLAGKLWIWFLYFWRFILLAFAIGFALGAILPVMLKYAGFDPVISLKYAKYMGNIAMLPASWLAFTSMACRRKESKRKLNVVNVER